MTVMLVLACLVIGAAELYMARSARRTADRLEKLEAIAVLQDERIESMSARLSDDGAPDVDKRLKTSVHRIDADLARITEETAKLRDRVGALADAHGRDRRLHQKMIRAIESLEHTVADVFEHTLHELDQAVAATLGAPSGNGDTARGIVCGGAAATHDALVRGYEQCAADAGLRVRFRVPGGADRKTGPKTGSEHARYYLSGKDPRELERDFLTLLDSVRSDPAPPGTVRPGAAPRDATAFRNLLRVLHGVDAGFAQIGPMVAVRTPDALLCGVLTLAECRGFDTVALAGDPAAVADRLGALPAARVRDLTAELCEPQPEPQPAPQEAGQPATPPAPRPRLQPEPEREPEP